MLGKGQGQRDFTFRANGSGRTLIHFVRFQTVYVIALGINTVALPLLVELLHFRPLVAQAIVTVVTMVLSYTAHKVVLIRRLSRTSTPLELGLPLIPNRSSG